MEGPVGPEALPEKGVPAAIRKHTQAIAARADVVIEVETPEHWIPLPPSVRSNCIGRPCKRLPTWSSTPTIPSGLAPLCQAGPFQPAEPPHRSPTWPPSPRRRARAGRLPRPRNLHQRPKRSTTDQARERASPTTKARAAAAKVLCRMRQGFAGLGSEPSPESDKPSSWFCGVAHSLDPRQGLGRGPDDYQADRPLQGREIRLDRPMTTRSFSRSFSLDHSAQQRGTSWTAHRTWPARTPQAKTLCVSVLWGRCGSCLPRPGTARPALSWSNSPR